MRFFIKCVFSIGIMLLCSSLQFLYGNNAVYEARKEAYIDSMLTITTGRKLILQAYRG